MIEVGCGNGESLSLLSKNLDSDAYGIEPSKKAVEHINNKFPFINIKQGFADKLPFDEEFFDYVHLGFFLYLVDRRKYLKSISEADRILKFEGFFQSLILTPLFHILMNINIKREFFLIRLITQKFFYQLVIIRL